MASGSAAVDVRSQFTTAELFWRNRCEWLSERGYTLRPRYRPDWAPSWVGTDKHYLACEDGWKPLTGQVLDAVRESGGDMVLLKRISVTVHPNEVAIGQYLTSPLLSGDPRNHCCPILDVLEDPFDADIRIIVMPLLRKFDNPKFQTVGEVVEFFRQAFEGLWFMHENRVAHRDCMTLNIMLDPRNMYPQMYHPLATRKTRDFKGTAKHYSRTRRPTKYYWIDFGLSRQYGEDDSEPLAIPILGGDRSVPEFQDDDETPRNPFFTDVYYLGNIVREDFIQKYTNFTFLYNLIVSMVNKEPQQRPSMEEATKELNKIISQLSWWTLRARLRSRKDGGVVNFLKDVQHIFRTASYLLLFLPPIPNPQTMVISSERKGTSFTRTFKALVGSAGIRRKNTAPPAS